MGLEIERKFLVQGDAWRTQVVRSEPMRQAYLTDGEARASVRVRIGPHEARLNIKAAVVGSARAEYDYPVPRGDAEEMYQHLAIGRLAKTRHWVQHAGHVWEIDVFEGENAGLIVAELELGHLDERFARPAWVGAEVTDDHRYYNHFLALHPFRQWPRP